MNRKVKLGIIGVGQIGKLHLERYAKIPDVEMVAACDIDAPELRRVSELHQIPHTYEKFRDLLERDDLEAVDVCLHNNLHAPVTIAALEAGKHVYCEKPMAEIALQTMQISEGIRLSHQLDREVTAEEIDALSKSTALKL
jgi:predicted dehydrogenase